VVREVAAVLARSALVGGLALTAGRSGADPPPAPTLASPEYGWLRTEVRQVRRPTCWTLTVRGRIHNPYAEPVEGVRMVVRLRHAGEAAREVERLEAEIDAVIPPGEWVPFSRELTMGCTHALFNDVSVVSFAARRGGQDLPIPPPAAETAVAQAADVASPPVSVPIVSSPVALP
jgi:hypothetical protein